MRRPSSQEPFDFDLRRALRYLGRALRRRCPNCGGGPLFARWIRIRPTCPRCRLRLDRWETDYFLGGYVVNFVAAELLVVAGGLAAILLTWPDVPWTRVQWGLIALMVPLPVFTYPYAKTLWLAIDLLFRPVTLADFEGHGENLGEAGPQHGVRPPPGPA